MKILNSIGPGIDSLRINQVTIGHLPSTGLCAIDHNHLGSALKLVFNQPYYPLI